MKSLLGQKWEFKNTKPPKSTKTLLESLRKERKLDLNPKEPSKISLKEVGISASAVKKAVARLKLAKKNKENVIVYGDYDADGVSATAILWEALAEAGLNAMPYIPDRFEEGYGINPDSIDRLIKNQKVDLIITVDNGIVAYAAAEKAKKEEIDLIVTDHHTKGGKKLNAKIVVHTLKVSGAGIAWFLGREISKAFKVSPPESLGLAAIGAVADQMPLTGVNRSLVKHGLLALEQTTRPGLKAIYKEALMKDGPLDTYHINFVIAPRLNSTGRLTHAMDSLRLLCTKNKGRALELARELESTNKKRQEIVQEVIEDALKASEKLKNKNVIIVSSENYHEGVIGLAAGRIVERFYRPTIVLAEKGALAKASGRSISGFNLVEHVRALEELIVEGGGHEMAAGFTIEKKNIKAFQKKFEELAKKSLDSEILTKKLHIDGMLNFKMITVDLINAMSKLEPYGLGNPTPVFATKRVSIKALKLVGKSLEHLKLKLEEEDTVLEAMWFGAGKNIAFLEGKDSVDVAYKLDLNTWNGHTTPTLLVKDIGL